MGGWDLSLCNMRPLFICIHLTIFLELTSTRYPRSIPPSPSFNSITPSGGVTAGGRAVFMSDGPMLTGRPMWSSMWLWHETFHIMEVGAGAVGGGKEGEGQGVIW